ncbi:MAG: hypothetical protein R3B72_27285 [Polyangiaceae bacterium]
MTLHKLFGLMGMGAVALVLAAAACTSDETGTGGSSTGTATGSNTGGSGTGTGMGTGGMEEMCVDSAAPTCTSPDPAHENITQTVTGTVTGTVVDVQGNPVDQLLTDVCGTNICLFGVTNSAGVMGVESMGNFTAGIGTDQEFVDVRLLYGSGKRFAKMAARLPTIADPTFGTINALNLPDVATGVDMAPNCAIAPNGTQRSQGGDVTQGDVTLSIPADAALKHDIVVYEESQMGFRSTVLDLSGGTYNFPAVDPALNLEVLVALAPINTTICPGAKMTFANTAGWAMGAEVEIFLNGTLTFNHYAPYGEWEKVAEGVVTAAGVETKGAEDIKVLGTYGVRLK